MLNEDRLREALSAAGLSAPVRWDDETTSTNETAMRLAAEGAPTWTLVAAGHQTHGRGRGGRRWVDRSARAVLLSVVVRPTFDAEQLGLVSLAAGAAMSEAVARTAGLDVRCKWPNDLLIDDAKVGGILTESQLEGGSVRFVVVGVGVNLEPPEDVAGAAGIGDVDEVELVADFLRRLDELVGAEPALILDAWRARADTLGRRVEATTVEGTAVRGVAADVDSTGALEIDTKAQGAVRVAFGDVRHLEPISGGPALREALTGGGMFDRFTADARAVVAQADRVRTELGHASVGPAHVLIALAEIGPNPASRALEDGRFAPGRAREDLARFVEEEANRTDASSRARARKVGRHRSGRLDAATKKLLETSLRVALRHGHDWIGVEHILLATLDRNDADVAFVFASQGVSSEVIRGVLEREIPPSSRRLRRRDRSR